MAQSTSLVMEQNPKQHLADARGVRTVVLFISPHLKTIKLRRLFSDLFLKDPFSRSLNFIP